jgi:hypothetical protein
VLRICAASLPMALIAWAVSEFAAALPLRGIGLAALQVIAGIGLATGVFYLACRLLRVEEMNDAIGALAGRFARLRR